MLISIITSTYNRAKLLQRAIQSIRSQTYTDWELIIVNDCSTDNTSELISYYMNKDKRIKSVFMSENFGTDTRPKNKGILNSIGEAVCFLDDDNEWLPDHLMILTKEMERHSKADIIYGDRMCIWDDEPDRPPEIGVSSDPNPSVLMDQNYIDTSDVLIKRKALFMLGGFDERYKKFIDWNLWVRATKANLNFFHIPKVITRYHLHKDMKSLKRLDMRLGNKPYGGISPQPLLRPAWDFLDLEIRQDWLGKQPPYKVAVYTLTWNRLEYTKRMYETLKKSGYPFDWFVVDNGSTDGTVEWLKKTKPHKVIFNKKNVGMSIGYNQAINAMNNEYDFIISIDNDCEINTDDWLKRLLYIFEAHYQIVLSPYVEGLVDNPGGAPRIAYRTFRRNLMGITVHLGGIFCMAHKSAYEDFRWDEDDFKHGVQDIEFCEAMQKKGYLLAYVEDMKVMHMETTAGQKKKFPDYFKELDKTNKERPE